MLAIKLFGKDYMTPVAVIEGETPIPFMGDVVTSTVGVSDETGWQTIRVQDQAAKNALQRIDEKSGVSEILPDQNGNVNGSRTQKTELSPKRRTRVKVATIL